MMLPLLAVLTASAQANDEAAALQALLGLSAPPTESPYIHVERDGDNVRGIIARKVPLDADHVMNDVLLCYGSFPEWFPLQTAARYVQPPVGDHGVIYGAFQFPWPIGTRDFEANITGSADKSLSPTTYVIEFEHKPGTGNIATMKGHWKVQPFGDDAALVVYDATIDFDTWVPGALMARGTRQFLPAIMEQMATRTATCADPQATRRSADDY